MKISKGMTNLEIADLLEAVAAAYKIKGEEKNKFRIIAYERASTAIEHLSSEAKDLWDEGKLSDVSGIGESIAAHLDEIFSTGKSKHFEKVLKGIDPSTFELIKVAGIGPKTAMKLVKSLSITSKNPLRQLEAAAKKGEIAMIEGFGENSENAILKSIDEIRGKQNRLLLPHAEHIASQIISWLEQSRVVEKADPLGSLRRKASTVGDVDIAVASNNPCEVIDHFCKYPQKTRVLEKGDKTASILIPGDKQVDLMVGKPNSYGALLQHFTGSKQHNIALREYARSLSPSLSLSEYGIRLKAKSTKPKVFKTEEEFYKTLGMEWIPPELREDKGEIELALKKQVPDLVDVGDIKADLQIHSSFDIETSHDLGESSMKDIVKKAQRLGYEYIAFTEHNPSKSGHNEKQTLDILKRKRDEVDKLNYSISESKNIGVKRVFNSLEIDILPDGKLPVSEKGLELLDFALVSVHSSFLQTRYEMTKRVISALSHPKVKIFAHPTARKLEQREGIELDWPAIFEYCQKNNKLLEINADPMRLDLPDFLVREAVGANVKLTLGTDAHHVDSMDNMKYGVAVARRGWAKKSDIVNTYSLQEFENMVKS